ncbi:YncE family protein [Thalassomonas viridans]|uniref:YncE family protein n=1 Tax=Thalassomonas viridans TaxID=137584 RepID=A0AAE9Z8K9_9GAMM|nr:YncE family protein [Thalassomonas viridans]WDE08029.1 YncE family protein [Thalassomonas viridans]
MHKRLMFNSVKTLIRVLKKVPVILLACSFALVLADVARAGRVVQNGIEVDFSLTQALKPDDGPKNAVPGTVFAGSDAVFNFTLRDGSGAPVSGVYPAGWMQRRAESIPNTPASCKNMVKSFIGGSILAQPTVNLNTYYVLVLNQDASISVVDPLFHFGGSNLLTMVPLSSPGFDWQLADLRQRLFVSLPKSRRLAVVDSQNFRVLTELEIPGTPKAIALQQDQHYLWLAYEAVAGSGQEASDGVLVFNTRTLEQVANFYLKGGPHHFAFSADDEYVFIAAEKADMLSVIDVGSLSLVKQLPSADNPVKLAYSPAADAVYISHSGDGTVLSLNASTLAVNKSIFLDPGITDLAFAPDGRHGVLVNPVNDHIYILDSLNDSITKQGKVEQGPDQVNFSDTLAYIRHRGSETVLMLPMDAIVHQEVPLQVVDFPGGQKDFGLATTPAPGIIQAPGENAVLVAHPRDKQVYYYKEGMAAPMGSFKNFSRSARAVIAVDRSLQEVAAGQYQTTGRPAEAGTYDVAFFLESPRVVHCFEVRVRPEQAQEQDRLLQVVASLVPDQQIKAQQNTSLTFRLENADTKAPIVGLAGLNSLTVLVPGIWKDRSRVTELGQGLYRINWQAPQSGAYYIQLLADWQTLKMQAPRQIMLEVM